MNTVFEPSYLAIYNSGELERRAKALEARLAACDICPRECGVNRLKGERSFCHSAYLTIVSSACAHHGEEPVLSGRRGSGTIFFGNCNMRCVFCQNFQISQEWQAQQANEIDTKALAGEMLGLQNQGCHNINFVSPSHFAPQIVRAVLEAVPMGLRVPLVYNTGGYDSLKTIKELDGIIDIYLPDLRYSSDEHGKRYSQAPDYVSQSRAAIREMFRQVGNLVTDKNGIAQKGLIVRHLILPNGLAGSRESLTWLAQEISPEVTVSIMSQYYPTYRATGISPLSRKITRLEYSEVVDVVNRLGLENGWLQEMDSSENYLPDFERDGHPFEPVVNPPEK
ncbi:MAG: radical SAM protein [Chloroflexi bacterium]|nr:radical SAM protein [Chloroflexota bacterium]